MSIHFKANCILSEVSLRYKGCLLQASLCAAKPGIPTAVRILRSYKYQAQLSYMSVTFTRSYAWFKAGSQRLFGRQCCGPGSALGMCYISALLLGQIPSPGGVKDRNGRVRSAWVLLCSDDTTLLPLLSLLYQMPH